MKIQSGPAANDEHELTPEQREARLRSIQGITDDMVNRAWAWRVTKILVFFTGLVWLAGVLAHLLFGWRL